MQNTPAQCFAFSIDWLCSYSLSELRCIAITARSPAGHQLLSTIHWVCHIAVCLFLLFRLLFML